MADVAGDGFTAGAVESAGNEAGVPVVRLTGEIDISNAEPIGDALEAILGPGARRVIVDVAGLDFMDSAGIAMLLRTAARVEAVEIRNPSGIIRRIIECTGLTGIFQLAD
jgi:anti-sigma B factor antagonist